jgi:hypothetical protein
MEDEEEEKHKKKVDKENIRLNHQSTISPTNDEEMRHAHSSNNNNSSIDEFQSI